MPRRDAHNTGRELTLDEKAAGRILADLLAPVPGHVRTTDADLLRMLESCQGSADLTDEAWNEMVIRLRVLAYGVEAALWQGLPTLDEPGSPAKLEELVRRAAAGEELFVRGDRVKARGDRGADVAGDELPAEPVTPVPPPRSPQNPLTGGEPGACQ